MSVKDSVRKVVVGKTGTEAPVRAMPSNCNSHYIDHCVVNCCKRRFFFLSLNVFDKVVKVVNIVKSQPLNTHLLNILSGEKAHTETFRRIRRGDIQAIMVQWSLRKNNILTCELNLGMSFLFEAIIDIFLKTMLF